MKNGKTIETALFCDCETDVERAAFFACGRAFETGVVAAALSDHLADVYLRASKAGAIVSTRPTASGLAPVGIRWGELRTAMGREIPPWVLAAMGCESVAGNYTPESLQALVNSLDAIRERVAGLIK